jgi:hypothetical protein
MFFLFSNTFAISLKMVCHTCEGRYPSFPTRLDSRLRGNDILSFQPKMNFGEGIGFLYKIFIAKVLISSPCF